jgi:hypothetical protein
MFRKSHPLEGSRQEAIPLPATTFDSFPVVVCSAYSTPGLWPQTHPGFPCCDVGCLCAASATHQAQGFLTSRSSARRRPLARSVPQKTLGALPCPIVYNVQIAWLPHGSNFSRAHGRGVARPHIPVAGPLLQVETRTTQNGWFSANFSPSLWPQPHCAAALSQRPLWHQRAPSPA